MRFAVIFPILAIVASLVLSTTCPDQHARRVGDTLNIIINERTGSMTAQESGDSDSSRVLTDSILVSVVEILPNGNLKVEGLRRRTVSNETDWMRISGIVRPNDIDASNSISSQLVSECNIVYERGGSDSQ